LVTQTVRDVSRGYDFLVNERGVDASRMALVGFSRGAQPAMIAGGVERWLAAVALLHGGHFDFYETGHLAAACPANDIGRIGP
jgi:dienelactone hydrolase